MLVLKSSMFCLMHPTIFLYDSPRVCNLALLLSCLDDLHLVEVSEEISSKAAEIQDVADLQRLAEKVRNSHEFVKCRALSRLSEIAEQMKFLRMVWLSINFSL